MLFNSIVLAICSSIDSLGIGIAYGIRKIKIINSAKLLLFFISFFVSIFSVILGNSIRKIFPNNITSSFSNILLIIIGMWLIIGALNQKEKKISRKENTTKIYTLFIKFLGITIKVIRNPISSDLDSSNIIDLKEALFLGLAMSIDSICVGISVGTSSINILAFPILISVFQIVFLSIGNYLCKTLNKISKIPDNIWNILSGIILLVVGIFRFVS